MDIVKIGTYTGKGATAEFGVSPEKKTELVRVTLQVSGGEFDGRLVSRDLYFSEKATKYTLAALRALGCKFPGNDITNLDGFGSTSVSFTVEHESYDVKDESGTPTGEQRTVAKVGFINGSNGIKPELVMDAAKKAAFKAKMMGTIAATAAPGGNGAAPVPTGKVPF
jgi:hypothetical protein